MSWLIRGIFALILLGSACSNEADERPVDAGSPSAGEGGGGGKPSTTGGAGAAADGGSTAGAAAESGSAGSVECNASCEVGAHCELVEVTCVRAPCPPLPMCVPDAGASDRDCDPRKITCKRTAPECPELQVPSVEGSCYGECVDVHVCQCAGPEACPLPEKFTCNMSAKHCTPYLR